MSTTTIEERTENLNEIVDTLTTEESEFLFVPSKDVTIESTGQELSSEDFPYTLTMRISDFDTDKELNKFIKVCERIIRISPEYRVWTEYIREVLGHHVCAVTGEVHSQTTVDIHHHPFTLYAIVKAIILKKISSGKSFCSYDISSEVIQLHYDMKAPFVLLVRSMHDKFHNGFLHIPMELVHGNYKYLLNNYLSYLDDDDVDTVMSRLRINRENCGWSKGYRWTSGSTGEAIEGN